MRSIDYTKSFIQIYSGLGFHYDPDSMANITIYDIANSLSQQNRYAGHTKYPYSVAQHSVLLAKALEKTGKNGNVYSGLMHDAHETVVPDIPRPLKTAIAETYGRNDYETFERMIQEMFENKFDYSVGTEVYVYDLRICSNEKDALMRTTELDWGFKDTKRLPVTIRRWTAKQAKFRFLAKYFISGNFSGNLTYKNMLRSMMYYIGSWFV